MNTYIDSYLKTTRAPGRNWLKRLAGRDERPGVSCLKSDKTLCVTCKTSTDLLYFQTDNLLYTLIARILEFHENGLVYGVSTIVVEDATGLPILGTPFWGRTTDLSATSVLVSIETVQQRIDMTSTIAMVPFDSVALARVYAAARKYDWHSVAAIVDAFNNNKYQKVSAYLRAGDVVAALTYLQNLAATRCT